MDKVRAKNIYTQLKDRAVGDWIIKSYINYGKSAVVLKAKKGNEIGALKIFDPELIERFGKEKQKKRIRRELALVGKSQDNLIKILDGGFCPKTKYYYIVMEFVKWPNLASALQSIPRDKIWSLISQLASAAKYLESLELVHRDIKPENIIVRPLAYDALKLLDFGVIRPFKVGDLTDEDQRIFLGTLRYSSPEFLLRAEKDTVEGWRALTFYQLGAVLHDLIMRKPIFQDFSEPFAQLVLAVKNNVPKIQADDIDQNLVLLANNCLIKDPDLRLKLCSWDDFRPKKFDSKVKEAKKRIGDRRKYKACQPPEKIDKKKEEKQRAARLYLEEEQSKILGWILQECTKNRFFPPHETYSPASNSDEGELQILFRKKTACNLKNHLYICVNIILIDHYSKSVRITLHAFLSPSDSFRKNLSKKANVIFEGVMHEKIVEEKIKAALYLIYDKAQQTIDAVKSDMQITIEGDYA
jgi:serine/threonine protein kinase